MKVLAKILKMFFFGKGLQYWLCVPEFFDTKKEKDYFIKETNLFLENKIQIKHPALDDDWETISRAEQVDRMLFWKQKINKKKNKYSA